MTEAPGCINKAADNVDMIAPGKPLGKLTVQRAAFLRRDLAGNKGLLQTAGNHIIFATDSAGLSDI